MKSAPARSAHTRNCPMAAARNVSPAARRTGCPSSPRWWAIFPIVVGFPPPSLRPRGARDRRLLQLRQDGFVHRTDPAGYRLDVHEEELAGFRQTDLEAREKGPVSLVVVGGHRDPSRASAPARTYLGIRSPLQGAGPRKGFVARQGRPEARRASAGASAEAYGQYAAQASDEHARRSPGVGCRSRKGSLLGDRRLRRAAPPRPLAGPPARRPP